MAGNKNRLLLSAFVSVNPFLLLLLALTTVVRAAAVVVFAGAAAQLIVTTVVADSSKVGILIAAAVSAAIVRGLSAWAGEVVSAKIAISEKTRYRRQLLSVAVKNGFYGGPTAKEGSAAVFDDAQPASLSYIATFGVEELSKFYTQLLPAALNAAIMPAAIGAVLLFSDGLSALAVAVTIPLIPVFMALIGMHTQERVRKTQEILAAIASRMSELVQAMPVIVGLGRAKEQARVIEELSDDYRQQSVQTLKVAFLSSLALELISTVSVAVIAVVCGIRLLQGNIELGMGLFVLLIVPECYAPLQDIGAAFHATDVAKTMFSRIRHLLERKGNGEKTGSAQGRGSCEGALLRWENLNVSYGSVPLFAQGINAEIASGRKVALQGASGSGKSSVVAALTGTLSDCARTAGTLINGAEHMIWVPQEPGTSQQTVKEELKFYDIENGADLIEAAGLQTVCDAPLAQLSPGELRRAEVVRAMGALDALALRQSDDLCKTLIILDEPTAHLDGASAEKIRGLIRRRQELYPKATWIISTHDQKLALLCDMEIVLRWQKPRCRDSTKEEKAGQAEGGRPELKNLRFDAVPEGNGGGKRKRKPFLAAVYIASAVLALLAAASSVSLAALSGWLIIQAGRQTPLFYLMAAIVGVRFFGIARSALAYWSRLAQHNAIFVLITRLRQGLWNALARKGLASRAILTPGKALAQLVGELRLIEQSLPRAVTPFLVAFLLQGAVAVVVALALPVFFLGQLTVMAVFSIVAAASWRRARRLVEKSGKLSVLCEQTMAYMSRVEVIKVNGKGEKLQRQLESYYRRITEAQKKYAYAEGMLGAFLEAALLVTVALTPWILWEWASGQAGRVALVGALMLANIALVRPSVSIVEAIRHVHEVKDVYRRLKTADGVESARVLRGAATGFGSRLPGRQREKKNFERLKLEKANVWWDQDSQVFKELNLSINAGETVMVTGPSGSGKSTLIAVLMGYLPLRSGAYRMTLDGSTVELGACGKFSERWMQARAAFAWCPQQAHIFSSTVRGNLQLASTKPLAEKELREVLDRVRLSELYGRREGLDYFVGSAGSRLSGGERTRLAIARALLTDADVIVLDEPTAHLDASTAKEVLSDIRSGLGDKTLVIVSHNSGDSVAGDRLFEIPQS